MGDKELESIRKQRLTEMEGQFVSMQIKIDEMHDIKTWMSQTC